MAVHWPIKWIEMYAGGTIQKCFFALQIKSCTGGKPLTDCLPEEDALIEDARKSLR